ncbi:MAG: DNA gyrase inhibitor YacG [Sulfitobacter sp.]
MNCPLCGAAVSKPYRPFCSRRCSDLDLANWLNGSYATPSHDHDDIEGALEAAHSAENKAQKPH